MSIILHLYSLQVEVAVFTDYFNLTLMLPVYTLAKVRLSKWRVMSCLVIAHNGVGFYTGQMGQANINTLNVHGCYSCNTSIFSPELVTFIFPWFSKVGLIVNLENMNWSKETTLQFGESYNSKEFIWILAQKP